VSITDLQDRHQLDEFLPRYQQAFAELSIDRKKQRLIVVLTKSDRFVDEKGFPEIAKGLLHGTEDEVELYYNKRRLAELSGAMRDWLRSVKMYHNFVNQAQHEFESVLFLPCSALGSEPTGHDTIGAVYPRGVLLPLLCSIDAPTEQLR
jgi:hypothetical protein